MTRTHSSPRLVASLCLLPALFLSACTKPEQASPRHASQGTARGSAEAPTKPTPKQAKLSGGAAAKGPASKPRGKTLVVDKISFAGPSGHREDKVFGRGEEVVALLSVAGFVYKENKGHLVGNVEVRKASGDKALVLRQRGLPLLKGKAPTKRPGELRAAAKLRLDGGLSPGRYRVDVVVEDRLGGGVGSGVGHFELVGTKLPRAKRLSLLAFRNIGDHEVASGSVVPLSFTAAGLQPQKVTRNGKSAYRIELAATLELLDATGRTSKKRQLRLRRERLFAPSSYPFAVGFGLPQDAPAGPYRLRLTLSAGKQKASKTLPLKLVERRFAIASPHLFDAGRLPRGVFRFGEQAFLRLAVQGFATTKDKTRAKLEVDIAVAGPGGVYLARKKAAQLAGIKSATWARVGRFPMQLPLQLPNLAPVGVYKVLMRARDLVAKREVTRELRFRLEGDSPKPLGSFRVDKLFVRRRADLPREKGDTFRTGRSYHLEVRAGGGKLEAVKRATYRLRVEGHLRLRLPTGALLGEWKKLFRYDRTLNYQPLRVLLPGTWKVPPRLPRGLYDLEIQLIDPDRNRVSTLRKRVELVP